MFCVGVWVCVFVCVSALACLSACLSFCAMSAPSPPHSTPPIPTHTPPSTGAPSSKSLALFFLLNILPFAWIFFSLGLGRKFYGDMTGSVGKDAREGGIDRSLTFEDVAGEPRLLFLCVAVCVGGWGGCLFKV